MSLADALEAAASELEAEAEQIRPANGDPLRLLQNLDAAAAGRVLHWLLAHRPADAQELGDAWSEEPAGMEVLREAGSAGLPKEGRRTLRRIQHRLRSRGVALPAAEQVPTVARLPVVEEPLSGAWISSVDPGGGRLAYFLEPHPAGGARIFEVIFDDARGILGLEVYQAARGKARRFLRDLTRRSRFPVCEAPVENVRAAVAWAAAHQPSDRPLPRGFAEWRSHVAEGAEAPEGPRLPGELVRVELGEVVDPGLLRRAAELIQEGRIGPWPPGREVLGPLLERIRTAMDSPLVVSGATRQGRLDDLLSEAVGEIFDAEGVELAAHRLRESAYVFWRQGEEDVARACLAAAASLGEGDLGSNPVARALLEVPLRPALEALARETPREEVPRVG